MLYQQQLQTQQFNQQLHQIDRTAEGAVRLRETGRELDRMNNLIRSNPPPTATAAPPSGFIPPEDRGAFYRGSGHEQPTPEEIKQLEAERKAQGKQKKNAVTDIGLIPVYDLYGQRIQ
jgi:hypothetical protein